jgi:hypothetical protein
VSGTNDFSINPVSGLIELQTNTLTQAEYVVSHLFFLRRKLSIPRDDSLSEAGSIRLIDAYLSMGEGECHQINSLEFLLGKNVD